MIVLDEEIHGPRLSQMIAAWYVGAVVSITTLRPHTHIQDEAIVTLLHSVSQPMFVTINVPDFWRVVAAHADYAVICVDLPDWQVDELPTWLRAFLRMPNFRTKAARMGNVFCLRPSRIEYYAADRHIHTLTWPTS